MLEQTNVIAVPAKAKNSTVNSGSSSVSAEVSREESLIRRALLDEFKLKGRNLYHNLKAADSLDVAGAQRMCFTADYGLYEKFGDETVGAFQPRRIKIDRTNIVHGRAKLYKDRGCGSQNDFIMSVNYGPEAYGRKLCPILDMWNVVDEKGFTNTIIAEQDFPKYKSFFKLLPELNKKPITKKEFDIVSHNLLDSLQFLTEKNAYHRDRSLRNFITNIRSERKEAEKLEARMTDCANSCYKSHTAIKPLPTVGGRQITDPHMVSAITGIQKKYDDNAEIFADAKTLLDIANGAQTFRINPDNGQITVPRNYLTVGLDNLRKGVFDSEEYEQLIENACANMPNHARKYAPVIKRALSYYANERYFSVNNFVADWKAHSTKDFASRAKKALKTAAAAVMIGAATYGLYSAIYNPVEIDTYKVHSEVNVETNNVENNYIDLDVSLWARSNFTQTPRMFFVKPGDNVSANLSANFSAVAKKYQVSGNAFNGIAYVESPNAQVADSSMRKFQIGGGEPGEYYEMGMPANYQYLSDLIRVPKNVPEGTVYNLVVELYPVADTLYNNVWDSDKQEFARNTMLLFEGRQNVFLRKRIPIIVEKDDVGEYVKTAEVGFDRYSGLNEQVWLNSVSTKNMCVGINKNLSIVIRVPELNYVKSAEKSDLNSYNMTHVPLDLPKGKSMDNLTLQTIVCSEGKIISQSFFPVKRDGLLLDSQDYYTTYEKAVPDSNFVHKVLKYTKEAEQFVK